MTPENPTIPDWARQERQGDLAWIAENLDVFWATATLAFEEAGRGAIFVDTTFQLAPDSGHPYAYFSQDQIEEAANEDTKRMVSEYDPEHEFVAVLLKTDDRISTYRVCAVVPEDRAAISSEPTSSPTGEPPDLETLMQWDAEGGCEAACPHACWVEPDGTCPHGNPSWLLKLGFI